MNQSTDGGGQPTDTVPQSTEPQAKPMPGDERVAATLTTYNADGTGEILQLTRRSASIVSAALAWARQYVTDDVLQVASGMARKDSRLAADFVVAALSGYTTLSDEGKPQFASYAMSQAGQQVADDSMDEAGRLGWYLSVAAASSSELPSLLRHGTTYEAAVSGTALENVAEAELVATPGIAEIAA